MHEPQNQIDPPMYAHASQELMVALDVLLRNAGACLSNDQRIAVLSIIIATGRALRRARGIDRATSLRGA